jgi:hypothetical protein
MSERFSENIPSEATQKTETNPYIDTDKSALRFTSQLDEKSLDIAESARAAGQTEAADMIFKNAVAEATENSENHINFSTNPEHVQSVAEDLADSYTSLVEASKNPDADPNDLKDRIRIVEREIQRLEDAKNLIKARLEINS